MSSVEKFLQLKLQYMPECLLREYCYREIRHLKWQVKCWEVECQYPGFHVESVLCLGIFFTKGHRWLVNKLCFFFLLEHHWRSPGITSLVNFKKRASHVFVEWRYLKVFSSMALLSFICSRILLISLVNLVVGSFSRRRQYLVLLKCRSASFTYSIKLTTTVAELLSAGLMPICFSAFWVNVGLSGQILSGSYNGSVFKTLSDGLNIGLQCWFSVFFGESNLHFSSGISCILPYHHVNL